LSLASSLLGYRFLDAGGPITIWCVYLCALLLADAAPTLVNDETRLTRVFRLSRNLLLALGAFVILADILLIPFSAYLLWFELLAESSPRGAVSFLYSMLAGFAVIPGCFALIRGRLAQAALLLGLGVSLWLFLLLHSLWAAAIVACFAVGLFVRNGIQVRAGRLASAVLVPSILLLSAVLLAVPLGLLVRPEGDRFVNRVLSPLFRDSVMRVWPRFPIVYDIPGYGRGFSSEELGRPPLLSSRPLFEIEAAASERLYLRTEILHSYRDGAWTLSEEVRRRAEAAPVRPSILDPEGARQLPRASLTVRTELYPALPHTLETAYIGIQGRSELSLRIADPSLGYVPERPLLTGEVLELHDRRVSGDSGDSGDSVRAGPGPEYLELHPAVSEEIGAIAEEFREEESLRSLANLARFFSDEFEYSLDPPQPRARSALVGFFLTESRSGYCVHFATAFTLIARYYGIPARYVTGYLVIMNDQGLTQPITGLSAHAWPEIWTSETGWTVFEATPPLRVAGSEGFDPAFTRIANDGLTRTQLSAIRSGRMSDEANGDEPENRRIAPLEAAVAVFGGLALLVVTALLSRIFILHRKLLTAPGAAARVVALGRRIAGFGPERCGWSGFGAALRVRMEEGKRGEVRALGAYSCSKLGEFGHELFFDLPNTGSQPQRIRFLRAVYRRMHRWARRESRGGVRLWLE
jgi:transglutaminase-like putative cysteine protease